MTLPETKRIFAPEKGWLEYFLLSFRGRFSLFSGANLLLVSGECKLSLHPKNNGAMMKTYLGVGMSLLYSDYIRPDNSKQTFR